MRVSHPPVQLPSSLLTAPSTPEIYTLSLHDALPICIHRLLEALEFQRFGAHGREVGLDLLEDGLVQQHFTRAHLTFQKVDRKSSRLNSSHSSISYAVFCSKKKTPTTSLCQSTTSRIR